MLKNILVAFLTTIALLLISFTVDAMSVNLAPKQSKVLSNSTLWTINATCTIETNQPSEKILVNAIKNESHVNGQKLVSGQKKSIHVHNHESISVSAEPGAAVTIVNQGSNPIQATCST